MKRRQFLKTTAGASAFATVAPSSMAALGNDKVDKPINVASHKQLFIDDRFIESSKGIKRMMNSPKKAGMAMQPIREREGPRVSVSSVLEVDGEYRMYYSLYVPEEWLKRDWSGDIPGYVRHMICLATSQDGINWQRKRVGLFNIGAGSDNAVVMPCSHGAVFIDPQKTRGSRFWFIGNITENPWWDESKGAVYRLTNEEGKKIGGAMYLCHSKNGINWKRIKDPILPFWCDTRNQAFFDPHLGKYVAFVRGRLGGLRVVCRGESKRLDNVPWPFELKPETPLGPGGLIPGINHEEWPVVMRPDKHDPPQTDLYTPNVNIYPWAQDVYLAFPPAYRHYDNFESCGRDTRGQYGNDGPVATQLSVSRNGIHWHRFREPYIPLGRMNELDSGTHYMGVGMIRKGDEIWMYYTGSPWTHGSYPYQPEMTNAIFRVVQRLDGFVSVDSGPEKGELVTPPIIFTGNRLQLNIDCGAMGEAWVEIQDENGNALSGYSFDESVSVDRNGIAQEVWWQKGPDVSELAGQPIRLHVKMRSAKLYAFQFAPNRS